LIPKYNPQKLSSEKKKVSEYVMDKIVIKVGPRVHLGMLAVAIIEYKKHVYGDRAFSIKCCRRIWRTSSLNRRCWWYYMVNTTNIYNALNLIHNFHPSYEKSSIFMERTIQYIKDRKEILMIIFHVERRNIN
jgi:hypothetical protein